MTLCLKCQGAALVAEVAQDDTDFSVEVWRCLNCGAIAEEGRPMGWTEAQKAKHRDTMKAVQARRKAASAEASGEGSVAVDLDSAEDDKDQSLSAWTAQKAPKPGVLDHLDALIADLERQLAETRGVRLLLIQRGV